MARILVAFASTHGHTAAIAARVAAVLGTHDHEVIVDGHVGRTDPLPHEFDLVVVGASIHRGAHQREIVDWSRRHAVALNVRPSALFSVCLAAAEHDDAARATARDYLDDFEDRTGWLPRLRTTFAGAIQYREYGLATRVAMRALMHQGGHPTDTTRDHDFTDWRAVDRFACDCAQLVAVPAGARR